MLSWQCQTNSMLFPENRFLAGTFETYQSRSLRFHRSLDFLESRDSIVTRDSCETAPCGRHPSEKIRAEWSS